MTTITITDTVAGDVIALSAAQSQVIFDYQGGADILFLSSSPTELLHQGSPLANTVIGGGGAASLALGAAGTLMVAALDTIAGSTGVDWITVSGGGTLTASAVDTLVGSTLPEAVTLGAVESGGIVNLLGGADVLTLANGANTLSAFNVETVSGGAGADWVTLGGAAGQSVSVSGTETLVGGLHDDAVTMVAGQTAAIVNLLGGTDSLALSDDGNSLSVFNVEMLLGGTGADAVTLGGFNATTTLVAAVETMVGAGSAGRWVTLSDAGTMTVSGIDTLVGSASGDTVTLAATANGDVFNGLGGFDSLTLSSGPNVLSVYNIESITGLAGSEVIQLGGVTGQTVTFMAVESAIGTDLADQISGYVGIAGAGGADVITMNATLGSTVIYLSQTDGSPFGTTSGRDTVTSFRTEADRLRVAPDGSLWTDLDSDGDGTLLVTSRGQNAVNLSSDEVVYLEQAVAGGELEANGATGLLQALGTIGGTGTALVLANDGTDSVLCYLDDFGSGGIAAENIRMLALFQSAVLQAGDFVLY